ncbi:MAG TPA: cytochrome c-type biogenesis protein [Xanthobacteraceae bacterium]|nr:cytochrome c-type biogenesis protein [Xanthobacteraceae bacterium]
MRRLAFALIASLSLFSAAFAVEPDEILADPALEARARALSKSLRCMVCQNQSIDDSNAPLARDLRILLRERIKSGESDEEVREFLVSRYGEFVLLEPPFNGRTLVLWALPFAGLALGGIALFLALRRSRIAESPLSAEEKQRLQRLLDGSDIKKK